MQDLHYVGEGQKLGSIFLDYSLDGVVGGANKVAQHGNVGTIHADAAGIHGKAKPFSLFQIHTSIIEFRKTKALRGQYAIETRRVHGTGRAMAPPRATRYLVELLPIVFLPSRHTLLLLQLCPCNFYSLLRPLSVIRLTYGVGCAGYQKGSPCLVAGSPQ